MNVISTPEAANALQATGLAEAITAGVAADQGSPLPRDTWQQGFPAAANLRQLQHEHVNVLYSITPAGAAIQFIGNAEDATKRLQDPAVLSNAPTPPPQPTPPTWYQKIQPTHWFLLVASLAAFPRLLPFWWGDEFYSVGFLVAPWAFWAVLRQPRGDAVDERHRIVILVTTMAFVAAGWLLRDATISLLGIAGALLLHAAEAGTLRRSWIPIGLLALTVPPPGSTEILVASQKMVAALSAWSLDFLGLPIVRDNFLLQGPNYRYSVEPLCTGLTGILAAVLLVGMVASHLRTPRRMAWMALAIAMGGTILLNVLRIVLLVAITEVRGPSLIENAFHEGVGLALSLAAFAAAVPPLIQHLPKRR